MLASGGREEQANSDGTTSLNSGWHENMIHPLFSAENRSWLEEEKLWTIKRKLNF